jgi:hypothetical protein
MIKNKIENKGWEILCDHCNEVTVGYVGQDEKPLETEYFGIICSACYLANNPEIIINDNEL